MSNVVRWGILGAAKIAREWVAPAIHSSARGRIEAVASRSAERSEAFAAPFGARVLDSYEALLNDKDIDAVYIPLPNSAHIPMTLAALGAGKHVLCEKPIAAQAAEIDQVIAARDRSGKLAAEAFMVAHHPQFARAAEMVKSGAIGRLCHVSGAFSFYNDDPDNIRNRPDTGGGALGDIGVYPMIATRLVTGAEPVSATARIVWENGIDATSHASVAFGDFHLDFYVSMRMAPHQRMIFHGTEAVLTLTAPFNPRSYGEAELHLRHGSGDEEVISYPRADHYLAQIDAFNASVLDGAPFACPLEFSKGNQRGMDMILAGANPRP